MRNAILVGLSAAAMALGGCTMEHASAIGNPQAGLQSPADVANNLWYGLYGGAYPKSGGPESSGSGPPQAQPPAATTAPRQSGAAAPQSPADIANEIYYGPDHGGSGVLSILR